MSDAPLQLSRELGAICTPHAPLALEGARLEATLRPRSAEECALALAALARAKLGALITGAGTQLAAANAPCSARVRLDASALCEPPEIDLDEGVARFAAGTTLREIEAQLAGSIWQLPLDPPAPESTLGGVLASAALGLRFGQPRDSVLGLKLALANGDVVKCGGRVVKNVTGYDLCKLFVGSNGALGVIGSAWLRLRPRPERVELLLAPVPPDAARALAAARVCSARVAAVVDASLAPRLCASLKGARAFVIELAGDEAAVAGDRAGLAVRLGAEAAPEDAIATLQAALGGGAIRFRVATLPTEVEAARAALVAAGAATLALPARGLVHASFGPDTDEAAFAAQLAVVANAATRASGAWRLEAAPLALRRGREVLGAQGGTLALQRALKRAYDPANVLNPGRGLGET